MRELIFYVFNFLNPKQRRPWELGVSAPSIRCCARIAMFSRRTIHIPSFCGKNVERRVLLLVSLSSLLLLSLFLCLFFLCHFFFVFCCFSIIYGFCWWWWVRFILTRLNLSHEDSIVIFFLRETQVETQCDQGRAQKNQCLLFQDFIPGTPLPTWSPDMFSSSFSFVLFDVNIA